MRAGRLFLLFAAAVACAPAQVTLSIVQNGVSFPAGAGYDFGSVAVGSVANTQFELTNTGTQGVYLTSLTIAGPGFSVACPLSPELCAGAPQQQLPILIAGGATLDFTAQFAASQPAASSSANMTIAAGNTITIILTAETVPGLTLLLNNQPVASGQTIPFGSVQVGSSETIQLFLSNPSTNPPLAVPSIPLLTSGDFTLSGAALAAPTVPPGGSAEIDITFIPSVAGLRQSTLTIGLVTYPLQGTGTEPPPPVFPTPSIQISLATPASAQQGSLSVTLASASASSGTGALTLSFQPSIAGVTDDPSITFVDGTRSAAFTVAEGASTGQFANGPSVQFSTGTTAGTITFAATLGADTAMQTVTIPSAEVGIDAAVAARNVACASSVLYCTTTNVQIQINGWDNTRTISQIVFTFYDSSGAAISPGGIAVDVSSAFDQYFAGSTLGGVFGVSALFPVNGNSDLVVAFEAQLLNSTGTAQTQTVSF